MKVRCLIVDDEPLAIRLIEKHIAQIESFEVVATCNTAMKAFEILNKESIDLLFLDIKMPSITGIDFLKSLKNPPPTIFAGVLEAARSFRWPLALLHLGCGTVVARHRGVLPFGRYPDSRGLWSDRDQRRQLRQPAGYVRLRYRRPGAARNRGQDRRGGRRDSDQGAWRDAGVPQPP